MDESERFPRPSRARAVAFYLPQFHPVPENDTWWGAGFTEWTNVAKAKPLFKGHWQPRLPADLGFYDLRVPEVRERQADLARDANIEAFCYWHYWFGNGRRILERPFNEVLASGRPDFGFCLAWANQPWTGVWHGQPKTTLLDQTYPGEADHAAHFQALLPAFRDRRYFKVDGKPLFAIYDPDHLRQTAPFVAQWQALAQAAGLPGLYFVGMSNKYDKDLLEPFDRLMSFGPGNYIDTRPRTNTDRVTDRLNRFEMTRAAFARFKSRYLGPHRHDYQNVVDFFMTHEDQDPRSAPCILPNWDNTPRSGRRGHFLLNASPELYEKMLQHGLKQVERRKPAERIIFIKAWNEWAEGNYLEPDTKYGTAFLDATRRALAADSV